MCIFCCPFRLLPLDLKITRYIQLQYDIESVISLFQLIEIWHFTYILHTSIVADSCGAKSSTISIFHASFATLVTTNREWVSCGVVAGRVVWVS